MSSNKLKFEISDNVANLILHQPEKHNAFDDLIIKDIKDTVEEISRKCKNAIFELNEMNFLEKLN